MSKKKKKKLSRDGFSKETVLLLVVVHVEYGHEFLCTIIHSTLSGYSSISIIATRLFADLLAYCYFYYTRKIRFKKRDKCKH